MVVDDGIQDEQLGTEIIGHELTPLVEVMEGSELVVDDDTKMVEGLDNEEEGEPQEDDRKIKQGNKGEDWQRQKTTGKPGARPKRQRGADEQTPMDVDALYPVEANAIHAFLCRNSAFPRQGR